MLLFKGSSIYRRLGSRGAFLQFASKWRPLLGREEGHMAITERFRREENLPVLIVL
jgi:hypothetical protein